MLHSLANSIVFPGDAATASFLWGPAPQRWWRISQKTVGPRFWGKKGTPGTLVSEVVFRAQWSCLSRFSHPSLASKLGSSGLHPLLFLFPLYFLALEKWLEGMWKESRLYSFSSVENVIMCGLMTELYPEKWFCEDIFLLCEYHKVYLHQLRWLCCHKVIHSYGTIVLQVVCSTRPCQMPVLYNE